MYSTPGRRRVGGPNANTPGAAKSMAEGPILEFTQVIEQTEPEEWQKRTAAIEALVAIIPTGSQYLERAAWYNTPKSLWHLTNPVAELLKDPRSTVVRRVCAALTELFNKCQQDARLLFKDIMPTVLQVHAQTVQVIRQSVQTMVTESIPEVPCKSVMPLWMERLKDKSPAVRDACSLYLSIALQSWTEEGYLTNEIWMQVGNCLLRTMRDPSPTVRNHTRNALERMKNQHPEKWENLIHDPKGNISAKDPKLYRWLKNLGSSEDQANEDLSVASKYTFNSETRYAARQPRISSPRFKFDEEASGSGYNKSPMYHHPPNNNNNNNFNSVPFSIAVTHREPAHYGQPTASSRNHVTPTTATYTNSSSTGAMVRPFQNVVTSPQPSSTSNNNSNKRTPPRPPPAQQQQQRTTSPLTKRTSSPQQQESKSQRRSPSLQEQAYLEMAKRQHQHPSFPTPSPAALSNVAKVGNHSIDLDYSETSHHSLNEIGPFIASMQELKLHAAKRRSRRSIMMQERFRKSLSASEHMQSDDDDDNNNNIHEVKSENDTPDNHVPVARMTPKQQMSPTTTASGGATSPGTPNQPSNVAITTTSVASSASLPPEHMVIAIRLLRAHKNHVDQIMETLKIEMDTLRDFDRLLEEPGRPTEEEMLTYFESVELCLNQRDAVAAKLRAEMDRISRGEFD